VTSRNSILTRQWCRSPPCLENLYRSAMRAVPYRRTSQEVTSCCLTTERGAARPQLPFWSLTFGNIHSSNSAKTVDISYPCFTQCRQTGACMGSAESHWKQNQWTPTKHKTSPRDAHILQSLSLYLHRTWSQPWNPISF